MKISYEKIISTDVPIVSSVVLDGGIGWYHFHPEFELSLVEAGHGIRCVGCTIEDYAPYDLTLLGGMVPHSYSAVGNPEGTELKIRNIKFSSEFAGADFFRQPIFAKIQQLLDDAISGVVFPPEHVRALIPYFDRFFAADQAGQVFRLCDILDFLSRIPRRKLSAEAPLSESDERSQRVLRYIHDNIGDPARLTLEQVARVAHLSPGAFSSYFSQQFTRRYLSYVNEFRVNIACSKLPDHQMAITEIAFAVGFENLSNFNRLFLRYKGCTPSAYRKKLRSMTSAENKTQVN